MIINAICRHKKCRSVVRPSPELTALAAAADSCVGCICSLFNSHSCRELSILATAAASRELQCLRASPYSGTSMQNWIVIRASAAILKGKCT